MGIGNIKLLRLMRLLRVMGLLMPLGSACWGVIGLAMFIYTKQNRGKMLSDAKAGIPVAQPTFLWKYCCGPCAIYYWEGVTGAYWITLLLVPCFACCCWQPTVQPLENGVCVGSTVQVVQVGYGKQADDSE